MTATLIADNVFMHASGGNTQKFPPQTSIGTLHTGNNAISVAHWHADMLPKIYTRDGYHPITVTPRRGGTIAVTVNGISLTGNYGAAMAGADIVVTATEDADYDFERFHVTGVEFTLPELYEPILSFKMPAGAVTIVPEFFRDGDIESVWFCADAMDINYELTFYSDGSYILVEDFKDISTEIGTFSFTGDIITGVGTYNLQGTDWVDDDGNEGKFSDGKDPFMLHPNDATRYRYVNTDLPEPGMSKGTVASVTPNDMDLLVWHAIELNGNLSAKVFIRQPLP